MDNPIRVAHVVGKYRDGGVEAVIFNYWKHIDRSRIQFDLIFDEDSPLPLPYDTVKSLGGRIFTVPRYQKLLAYSKALEGLFTQERWPIVHSHINALSVFPLRAAKKADVPVRVAHSHSAAGRGEKTTRVLLKNILKSQSNRYPTHRLACSRYAGEWLFGKDSNFMVLNNAIELQRFSFDERVRARTRADLGIEEGTFVIGHVGRFMEQKNHTFLIDVFSRFVNSHSNSLLLLVGDGELRPNIENMAVEYGVSEKIKLLGQINDPEKLYQAFDLFVLPSFYEGLPVVGVEAQRSGLSCLFSDAITREVDVTGNICFLPIDDPAIWVEALIREANVTVTRNRYFLDKKSCFEPFEIEKAAPELLKFYERAISSLQ